LPWHRISHTLGSPSAWLLGWWSIHCPCWVYRAIPGAGYSVIGLVRLDGRGHHQDRAYDWAYASDAGRILLVSWSVQQLQYQEQPASQTSPQVGQVHMLVLAPASGRSLLQQGFMRSSPSDFIHSSPELSLAPLPYSGRHRMPAYRNVLPISPNPHLVETHHA
jgi:hypothetical protein